MSSNLAAPTEKGVIPGQTKLRDYFFHGIEIRKVELREGLCSLTVAEELVGGVPGPLTDPVLPLPEGEAPGDEGAAEAVGAEGAFVGTRRGQVGSGDLGQAQVTADAVRHVIHSEGAAVLVDENQVFGLGLSRFLEFRIAECDPLFEGRGHSGRQSPEPGMVRFVFVEADRFVFEVDVLDLKRSRFLSTHTFTVKERVEHAPLDRDVLALQELFVLARVQDGKPLAGAGGGEPPFRDWGAIDVARELGQVEHPIDEHAVVATCRGADRGASDGKRKIAHHLIAHGARDQIHRHIADRIEAILLHASLGRVEVLWSCHFDLVGEGFRQRPIRPLMDHLGERGHAVAVAVVDEFTPKELVRQGQDRSQRLLGRGAGHLQRLERVRLGNVVRLHESPREIGEDRGPLGGLFAVAAEGEFERGALVLAYADAGGE